jgi:ABC-type lipoprotein export system ATPase subunit
MRINKISVTNLFGIFNHTISLKLDERITIIHGPNGFGKTILLRMLNGLFNSSYSEFSNIPFNEFRVEFDDERQLVVSKSNKKNHKSKTPPPSLYLISWDLQKSEDFSLIDIDILNDSRSIKEFTNFIEKNIPEIIRIDYRNWLDSRTKEPLSLGDVLARVRKLFPDKIGEIYREPNWLINVKESVNVRLIEAQRLLNLSLIESQMLLTSSNVFRGRGYPIRSSPIASVAAYSEEIAEHIQGKLAEYGELAQSLDRTFPARVVKRIAPSDLTDEKIHTKLGEIEEKRYRLIEAGLLNQDEDPDFQVDMPIDKTAKNILSVYVEDVENKLRVFQELAQKIEILKRIINSRFCYKSISVNKDKGFIFQSHDGTALSPANLSSGEQHQLIMLYELLFKSQPNSLILIDEPELSLHVAWQAQFLKDLQEIAKLVNIDVLMATHSPDIISDRWDLTVELKGP